MEQLRINNLQENKTLGEVLKENGVSFEEFKNYWKIVNTEFIGSGQWGKIFDIGNNKVLKVSQDDYEYKAVLKLKTDLMIDNNLWYKHIINYPICICPVNENFYNDEDIKNAHPWGLHQIRYYYIQEKLYQLSDYETDILNLIEDYYDSSRFEEMNYEEGDRKNIEEYILQELPNFNEYYIIDFIINVFHFVLENSYHDMHIDNIMKDSNGNYKLIDLRL